MLSISSPDEPFLDLPVDQEPRGADPDHDLRALDHMRRGETLDSLQDDGEAQSREKHGVDQRSHHLRPDPAEGIFVCRLGFLGEAHGDQSHQQVRQHRKRCGDPTDHHFHNEKPKSQ
uniref:Uncharacterized protein n=1 Tax=Myripristis murdjan TaxID=586833 RepID=A0A667XE98_9TELE